jgi:glycosyltransferase involved in cell wall biosynthesis
MLVWIFQTGEPLHIDGESARPMRAMNLANKLAALGHDVVIWSSSFNHQKKSHRKVSVAKRHKISERICIRLINSVGYKNHVGFKRLLDHGQLGFNLAKALRTEKNRPDIAFIGYPTIEFAYSASKWLKSNNVPFVVDVKDQWPHILSKNFPIFLRLFVDIILYRYYYMGRKILSDSDAICSMTEGFLEWAQTFCGRISDNDFIAPLTSFAEKDTHGDARPNLKYWHSLGVEPNNASMRLMFVGNISRSFNFSPIYEAAKIAQEQGKDWQFVICGDGDYRKRVERKFSNLDNVIFPGWINRDLYADLAKMAHVALAPYHNEPNYQLNIPNKIIDALMLGKPIIAPLSGEVKSLVNKYECGLIYEESSNISLFEKITFLAANPIALKAMAENSKNVYQSIFAADEVYTKVVNKLELLVSCTRAPE